MKNLYKHACILNCVSIIIIMCTSLFFCVEAKSQIVADAGGPYFVNTESSIELNGTALIPGNNLRQIGLGLHNYHSAYKELPPAIITDSLGNPLYSWRVLILPFIEEADLYYQFDLSKAWDDPVNLPLLDQMPDVFRRLGTSENDHYTDFAAPVGPNVVFTGTDITKFRDILDGLANTIFVAEVAQANIPWTAPTDVNLATNPGIDDPNGFSSALDDVIMVLFADGGVQFLAKETPQAILDALFTRNGGETMEYSEFVVDPDTIDTYEWDLNNDGVFETFGANPTFAATGLSTGSYPVQMRVTTTTDITTTVASVVEVQCSAGDIIPCGNNKIIVCHVPPGNPANAHEICVNVNSANNHVANHALDYLGYCDCNNTSGFSANMENDNPAVDYQTQMLIYPNPFSDEIQIKLWSEEIGSVHLQLFDITGKLLITKDQLASKGENQFSLNVNNLNDGLYLIRVQTAKREQVLRVIKARN